MGKKKNESTLTSKDVMELFGFISTVTALEKPGKEKELEEFKKEATSKDWDHMVKTTINHYIPKK